MDIGALTEQLSEAMREGANVHAVFGEPVKLDTKTVIPVAVVVAEGGGGYGESKLGSGAGGGLEVHAVPLGFISEEADGSVQFHEIVALQAALDSLGAQAKVAPSSTRQAPKSTLARVRERVAALAAR